MSAVDVLYAAMPAYVYLWPDLLGFLLTPLLEFQSGSLYTNPYAAQDLGLKFSPFIENNSQYLSGQARRIRTPRETPLRTIRRLNSRQIC